MLQLLRLYMYSVGLMSLVLLYQLGGKGWRILIRYGLNLRVLKSYDIGTPYAGARGYKT